MKLRPPARRPYGSTLACILLFVVLAVGGLAVTELDRAQQRAATERLEHAQAGNLRALLVDELYRSINLARGLRAFVSAYPDLGDVGRLETLLAQLYAQGVHVRNVGVAPDNVLRYVYPLEGNEAAVGLRYKDHPDQYRAVRRAIQIRSTVLTGPVDLVQGGRGLINRTPVFLPDGSYWGTVSLVLDVEHLVATVRDRAGDIPVHWAVRSTTRDGEPASLVVGDAELFDAAGTVVSFAVPDGAWEVVAVPSAPAGSWLRPAGLRALAVVLAAALAGLVFQVLRARRRVLALSLHDPLTGLANRRLLTERFGQAAAQARRTGRPLALLYIDLDAFKPINDVYGHRAGDHVLMELGCRLHGMVRATDTVARMGGDEFVVLLPDTDEAGAAKVVGDLEAVMADPFRWHGHALSIGLSVGVGRYPLDGDSLTALLQHADGQMYAVKRARRQGPAGDERAGATPATPAGNAGPPPENTDTRSAAAST